MGGETPPQYFQGRSKIFLINEKSVHDKAWIVRIQVGPTSECFRQGSVHDDGWKFYKQCSTVIGRVVLSQSRGRHLTKFSQTYYCRSAQSTIGPSNHWIVRVLRRSKGVFLPKDWSKYTVESCWKCSKFLVWHWGVENGMAAEGSSVQFAPRV